MKKNTRLCAHRVRLPASTVPVAIEPSADGAATVVIRYRRAVQRPLLQVLEGGLSAAAAGDLWAPEPATAG